MGNWEKKENGWFIIRCNPRGLPSPPRALSALAPRPPRRHRWIASFSSTRRRTGLPARVSGKPVLPGGLPVLPLPPRGLSSRAPLLVEPVAAPRAPARIRVAQHKSGRKSLQGASNPFGLPVYRFLLSVCHGRPRVGPLAVISQSEDR
jgi:hypothetical protein